MTPETVELEVHSSAWRGARGVERACIVLLEAELDIALGYLRLADAETGSNAAHADELIAKANNSHKTVLNGLATVSPAFEEERQVLRDGLRLLQDAIRSTTRRRQQAADLHQFVG